MDQYFDITDTGLFYGIEYPDDRPRQGVYVTGTDLVWDPFGGLMSGTITQIRSETWSSVNGEIVWQYQTYVDVNLSVAELNAFTPNWFDREDFTALSGINDTIKLVTTTSFDGTETADVVESSGFSFKGRGGDDVFLGTGTGVQIVEGGAGNDTLTASNGESYVYGGTGDDIITSRAGSNTLRGEDGNDTIQGGRDFDAIQGGAGADDIRAGAGDDFVTGGDGDDVIRGQGGNDRLYGDSTFGPETGNDTVYGGAGDDLISGGGGNDRLYGGADNDVINGDTGEDILNGGGGDDVLNGGQDNDRLTGSGGNDQLDGGAGDDILSGGAGDDLLIAFDGNDRLNGGTGNDQLVTGFGDQRLNGGAGADLLQAAAGRDILTGGADADRFEFTTESVGGPTDMLVRDFNLAEDSLAIVQADMRSAAEQFDFFIANATQMGSRSVLDLTEDGGDMYKITLRNVDLADLTVAHFHETDGYAAMTF